jgi:acyl carrier protein
MKPLTDSLSVPNNLNKGGEMEDVLVRVQEAFHDAFDTDPQMISLETTPSEVPAWDSVGHLDLANRLEQSFGITLDVDDLMEMENVREIVRIVQSKLQR